jgi:2-amino-4-hydroxy-6-hydroxymethyldihydropteridine diphosphokinase
MPQFPRIQTAHIGLGSNLEDPMRQVRQGFEELARLPGTQLLSHSSLYRSAPVGKPDQPDFVNAVAVPRLARALRPAAYLLRSKWARSCAGERNGPRTLTSTCFAAIMIHGPGLKCRTAHARAPSCRCHWPR